MNREVVVTGIGMMTPAGIGHVANWSSLVEGRTASVAAESPEAAFVGCRAVATVPAFKSRDYIRNRKSIKLMTRPVQLGVAAAGLAWADAGFSEPSEDPERLGAYVGAGQAFAEPSRLEHALKASRDDDGEFDIVAFGERGIDLIHPLWLIRGLSNNVLGFVSLDFNAQGPNNNYCNSGVSSTQAIIEASRAVRDGRLDLAFAGGYDCITNPEGLLGYGRLGLLSDHDDPGAAHRPFDADRSGMVPAEGATFLILESREHAEARGATMYASIIGGAVRSDAFGVAEADPAGGKVVRSLRGAFAEAGVPETDLVAIAAHAAGSPFDAIEASAYRAFLGERAGDVLVMADKGVVGHTVAACGGVASGFAALAIHHRTAPPIANLDRPASDCAGLNFVTGKPQPLPDGVVAVVSAGMGGQGAALLLAPA